MILGAILAGGEARRFGSDKALALLDGRPLIAHVEAVLKPWVDVIVVCGREGKGLSLPDRPSPGLGPLGGIAAALHYAKAHAYERVLTMPCDTPAIDFTLISSLISTAGAVFIAGCPVIGIWPATLTSSLDGYLAAGRDRAMRAWTWKIGALALDLPVPVNINRQADLELFRS